jgi:tellurite resistance protein TerC
MMEFLDSVWLGKPLWMWAVFIGVVLALLAFDLGLLNRDDKEMGVKESLNLSAFYIAIACLFGGWLWLSLGPESSMLYFTGFIVEKTLAMDNVFVISLVFTYFAVPRRYQRRVLFWGILGVILLRGLMIGLGAALVTEFEWVLYIFAAFLVFTGIKMLIMGDAPPDIANNGILKFMKRHMRITTELQGNKFFVRMPHEKTGKMVRWATPLFVCLLLVEIVDVIFAIDSVPAIFALTTDPYLVYTSNIFAILGLRALYFALAAVVHKFHHLKTALSMVLIFIGGKVFAAYLLDIEKVPASISLGVTFLLLIGGVVASYLFPQTPENDNA